MGKVAPRDGRYRIPTVVVIIELGQAMQRGSADDRKRNIGGQKIEISLADMETARVGTDGVALRKVLFKTNSNADNLFQPFIVQTPRQ